MRFLPALLLLGACTPSGVYMITIPYVEGSIECDTTLDENFVDGFSPDPSDGGSSDWTYTESYTGADSVGFFHIAPTSGGTAVLTWGDSAYPGVAEGDGWTFTWAEDTQGSDTAEHKSGYSYTESFHSVTTTTFHITQPPFADIAGTVSGSSTSTREYTESDKWDEGETSVYEGQIPSDQYLVYKESGDLYPQANDYDVKDCKDSDCTITLSDSCTQTATDFTAKQVSGEDVMLYDTIKGDGQSGSASVDTGV